MEREIEQEWPFTAYYIVKYKPEYYNEKSHYTREEWGEMGDIEKTYDGHLVTLG